LNLFLNLEDVGGTSEHAESDLDGLGQTFVVRPHEDLGRGGPVFVPGALKCKNVWLAPEQIADRVCHILSSYYGDKSLFLDAEASDGDDANYKMIVVVFTDLPADRAQGVFDDVLQHFAICRIPKMESCSAVLRGQ
jgi:hypothetical protein